MSNSGILNEFTKRKKTELEAELSIISSNINVITLRLNAVK